MEQEQVQQNIPEEDVAIYVAPKKRPIVAIAVFIAMLSNLFLTYGLYTAGATVADAFDGWAVFALMFTAGNIIQVVLQPMMNSFSKKLTMPNCVLIGAVMGVIQAIICVLAPNMTVFIVGRAIGGISGAFTFAGGLSLIGGMFPAKDRAKWMGLYTVFSCIGAIGGPAIAGVFASSGNWQGFVWVVVAIAVVAMILFIAVKPKAVAIKEKAPMDVGGIIFLVLFIVGLMGILSFAGSFFPWNSAITYVLAAVAVIGIIGFIAVERKAEDPVFPLSMFKYNAFLIAGIAVFFSTVASNGLATYVPTFMQVGLGMDPAVAGLASTGANIVAIALGGVVGIVLSKKGCFKSFGIFCGLAEVIVAVVFALIPANTNPAIPIVINIVFYGLAGAIGTSIWHSISQTFLPTDKIAIGVGGIQTFLVLGAMIGTALFAIPMNQAAADPGAGLRITMWMAAAAGVIVILTMLGLKKKQNA